MISVFFIYWNYTRCMEDAFANRETSGNPDIILKTHKNTAGGCSPSQAPASEALPPGTGMPDVKLPARTAASDGQRAFTRARASAQGSGLR